MVREETDVCGSCSGEEQMKVRDAENALSWLQLMDVMYQEGKCSKSSISEIQNAIEAVEKQIPAYAFYDSISRCPKCGERLHKHYKYCAFCGQRVKQYQCGGEANESKM